MQLDNPIQVIRIPDDEIEDGYCWQLANFEFAYTSSACGKDSTAKNNSQTQASKSDVYLRRIG
jgi:hypothetical protein